MTVGWPYFCQNQENKYQETYLEAARNGSFDIIVWLEKNHQINFDKNKAVLSASSKGRLEIVKYLVL